MVGVSQKGVALYGVRLSPIRRMVIIVEVGHPCDAKVIPGTGRMAIRIECRKVKAKAGAQRAKQMSNDMGYYWGKKDADEVLAEIEKA